MLLHLLVILLIYISLYKESKPNPLGHPILLKLCMVIHQIHWSLCVMQWLAENTSLQEQGYLIIIVEPLYIDFWEWEGKGVGLSGLQKSLSTPTMLWFCDTSSCYAHPRSTTGIFKELSFFFLFFFFLCFTELLDYAKCGSGTLRCCRYTKQAVLNHYNKQTKK